MQKGKNPPINDKKSNIPSSTDQLNQSNLQGNNSPTKVTTKLNNSTQELNSSITNAVTTTNQYTNSNNQGINNNNASHGGTLNANTNAHNNGINANDENTEILQKVKKEKIRPLAEPGPIPTDKDELIDYLTQRLEAAENSISDAHEYILKQQQKRKKLEKELNEKIKELDDIRKSEAKTLQDKVQIELQKTLERAISDKVNAEEQRDEALQILQEREMLIQELDYNIRVLHAESCGKSATLDQYMIKINELEDDLAAFKKERLELIEELEKKGQRIIELTNEVEEMKGVMTKLADVRSVLNRILGNTDALLNKKQKEILESTDFFKINTKSPSAGNKPIKYSESIDVNANNVNNANFNSINNNNNNNNNNNGATIIAKKPGYMVNEDDFWYAPGPNNYGKDYGGRAKNYNENFGYLNKQNQLQASQEDVETRESRKPTPQTKLPRITKESYINPNAKQEILYKADEYIDEYTNVNSKKPIKKK